MEVKPGYKQTEVGVIPEDWEVKRIGDFTDCTAGGTPSTKVPNYWGGDIRWMRSGELHLKEVDEVEGRITEEGLRNSSTKIVPENCILIGLAGQGKTRGTVAINRIPLCTNQSIAAIFPNKSFVPKYLFHNLNSRYKQFRELSSGEGGRGGLNLTLIKSMYVPLPPTLTEQTAIATALSDADALIQSLERLIAKKRDVKQGAMQELLTGKKRLPGFGEGKGYKQTEIGVIPEDWLVKTIAEIAPLQRGFDLPTTQLKEGSYPVVYSNVMSTLNCRIESR
ncbi:MAG TPA: restriction endonuclease subunit S [Thermodesulforhabdus norvegica]|uniref:Restriction endonuclease subunit S n=1 Tax=Thermodesulforhabdus norvegica TaxID=39841 RepID=A0A7C0WTM3_9BACT|nr:restriction endonuclease subunit S [Thermodesulforhabdus norvegica]